MPNAMTFTSLKADAAKYLERGSAADADTYAEIPSLINLAERRIARDLKVDGLQATVTTTLKSGVSVYKKPDRWRSTISINFGAGVDGKTRTPLFTRSYEYCRNVYPDESITGTPLFYADYDSANWLVVPTPVQDYPAEILYKQMEALLDENHQTNWITEYTPDLLLYATLSALAFFIRAYDQAQTWDAKYKETLAAINGEEIRSMVDRNATRQGS